MLLHIIYKLLLECVFCFTSWFLFLNLQAAAWRILCGTWLHLVCWYELRSRYQILLRRKATKYYYSKKSHNRLFDPDFTCDFIPTTSQFKPWHGIRYPMHVCIYMYVQGVIIHKFTSYRTPALPYREHGCGCRRQCRALGYIYRYGPAASRTTERVRSCCACAIRFIAV